MFTETPGCGTLSPVCHRNCFLGACGKYSLNLTVRFSLWVNYYVSEMVPCTVMYITFLHKKQMVLEYTAWVLNWPTLNVLSRSWVSKHTVQEDGLIDRSKPLVTAEIRTRHVVVKVNGTVGSDHIRHNDLYIVLPHVEFFVANTDPEISVDRQQRRPIARLSWTLGCSWECLIVFLYLEFGHVK